MSTTSAALRPATLPTVGRTVCRTVRHAPRRRFIGVVVALALFALFARPGAAGRGTTPPDLIGSWAWTTISSVGYVDTSTRQLQSPSGMSARFTFSADGRYRMTFYVRQQTYGLISESTTTHEGTVVFAEDGSFTMKPRKGHYKGSTGARLIDRAMTAAERKPLTYRWQWRDDDDGRHLYLGPSADALSRFAPAE